LKNLLLVITLCALFITCNTSSEKEKPEEDSLQYYPPTPVKLDQKTFRSYFRQLSAFFDSSLLQSGFNGGILIALHGNIVYEKYKGKTDPRKNDSINNSTALHIASTTKTFTATAILRLAQENRLSLNDTITKFFPAFPYPGITVKL
jgi:CubicO group peptidase (beta-lactamase class C family)